MNNRQATIEGLKKLGFNHVRDSAKYEIYEHPFNEVQLGSNGFFHMVGKSGALRLSKGKISDSISRTGTKYHSAIKEIGRSGCTTVEQAENMLRELLSND